MNWRYKYHVGEQVGFPEAENPKGLLAAITDGTVPTITKRKRKWFFKKFYFVESGGYEWGWIEEYILSKVLQCAVDDGSVMASYMGITRSTK